MKRFELFFIFFLSIIMILTSAGIRLNVNLNLNEVEQISGKVEKISIVSVRKGSLIFRLVGRDELHLSVFNSPYSFEVYRFPQDYSKLLNNIQVGDNVKIYFGKPGDNNSVSDVFQIEKNGQILLAYQDYNRNLKFLSVLVLIVGIIFILIGIWRYKKSRKKALA